MKRTLVSLVTCCSLCLVAGCGYTTRTLITNKFSTVYITPFVNKVDITGEIYTQNKYRVNRPMLETEITGKVVNRFLMDGNLRPVSEESADLSLKGEVVEFRRDPLRYDDNENITEYRINIIVNIKMWDNIDDRLMWEENGFTADTTYFATGSEAISESQAVDNALDDLARRIIERTVEQW
ncbi:MAG: LPS assembly lipoprotein LptE [Candidatus Omnitrophota bacterium]